MQLQAIRKKVNLQEWTQMVIDCHNSGLTIKDWCAQNGVNLITYYYHQSCVFEAIGDRPPKNTSRAMTPTTDPVEFLPIRPIHVSSCTDKEYSIDPYDYLVWVLKKAPELVANWELDKVAELTPDNYQRQEQGD